MKIGKLWIITKEYCSHAHRCDIYDTVDGNESGALFKYSRVFCVSWDSVFFITESVAKRKIPNRVCV